MMRECRFTESFAPTQAEAARIVTAAMTSLGDGYDHVELALAEAVTNVVDHAAQGPARVEIGLNDHGELTCDVVDQGGGIPAPIATHMEPKSLQDCPTRGFGLQLIQGLAQRVESIVHSNQHRLRLTFS